MPDPMQDSILNDIKKVLGLAADYDAFDVDVMLHINSVCSTLNQLGLGPIEGFMITGPDEKWGDLINNDVALNDVKSYMYNRVRMMFDPPANPRLFTAMELQIKESEWRLNITREFTPFEAQYPPPAP